VFEDLVGQGVLGLISAVDRYDPERGACFSTFAVRHIEGRVLDALRALDPLSQSARRRVRQVARAEENLRQRLGRAPGEAELSVSTGLDRRTVRTARRDAAHCEVSLDAVSNEAGDDWHDAIADDADDLLTALIDVDLQTQVRHSVAALPERERAIIDLLYCEGLTMREIAARLNVSEARICQLHSRAVGQLRAVLQQNDSRAAGVAVHGSSDAGGVRAPLVN
jgi:RNA polymerase sigma factor for flagellar operon FliA